MTLPGLFTFLFGALLAASLTNAQAPEGRPASRQFQWKWKNDGVGFQLATCQQMAIEVKSWNPETNDTHGIPPYYMMAFPVGGTPVTKHIGNRETDLVWEVTHAPGTNLLLTVVDASGSFGGVPPRLFQIIPGVSTSCVVAEPISPSFTISSNITGNLETCEPWGITIKGGTPPYNLSIAAVNSPVITNVTIPSGFDAFTYINRADPNGQMVIGVADFEGRWATGVPLVNTTGSTDIECVGLVSSNGVASQLEEEARARRAAANKKRTNLIVGITVPLVVVFLAALGFGVWWFLRRKKQEETQPKEKDLEPYAFKVEPLQLPGEMFNNTSGFSGSSKAALIAQSQAQSQGGHSSTFASMTGGSLSYVPASDANAPNTPSIHGSFAGGTSTSAYTQSHESPQESRHAAPFSTFTPNRKAAEAAQSSAISPDSEYASGSGMRGPDGQEIVIQHRDGGVVRELPPPYADRSLQQ